MLKVTYNTYSSILDKSFVDTKIVQNISDFKLFAYALFSGNWSIISVENL